jgi:ankyrin repeat protein
VKILVAADADVNARDSKGDSLLQEARFRGHTGIEQILLNADATE